MLHLSGERLAALADEEPTAAEAEHLAACLQCTRERAAHGAVVRLAADERSRIAPPLTEWSSIASRLRAEKVIASPAARRGIPRRWMAQAAAALVLVAAGAAAGRMSAGQPVLPWSDSASIEGGTTLADDASFASIEEAEEALRSAEASYRRAIEFIVETNGSVLPTRDEALRSRLATLDEVASTTARALDEVPYDPVLNSYYLSTLGARDATLRQLGAALPEGVRLTSY